MEFEFTEMEYRTTTKHLSRTIPLKQNLIPRKKQLSKKTENKFKNSGFMYI